MTWLMNDVYKKTFAASDCSVDVKIFSKCLQNVPSITLLRSRTQNEQAPNLSDVFNCLNTTTDLNYHEMGHDQCQHKRLDQVIVLSIKMFSLVLTVI